MKATSSLMTNTVTESDLSSNVKNSAWSQFGLGAGKEANLILKYSIMMLLLEVLLPLSPLLHTNGR